MLPFFHCSTCHFHVGRFIFAAAASAPTDNDASSGPDDNAPTDKSGCFRVFVDQFSLWLEFLARDHFESRFRHGVLRNGKHFFMARFESSGSS